MNKSLDITVDLKTNWTTFGLFVVFILALGGITWFATRLLQNSCFCIVLFLIILYVLLVLVLLHLIQCGTDIAKKALELQIELEKRKTDDDRRASEDKKHDAAEEARRKHEIELAQLASTIKVEVADV